MLVGIRVCTQKRRKKQRFKGLKYGLNFTPKWYELGYLFIFIVIPLIMWRSLQRLLKARQFDLFLKCAHFLLHLFVDNYFKLLQWWERMWKCHVTFQLFIKCFLSRTSHNCNFIWDFTALLKNRCFWQSMSYENENLIIRFRG